MAIKTCGRNRFFCGQVECARPTIAHHMSRIVMRRVRIRPSKRDRGGPETTPTRRASEERPESAEALTRPLARASEGSADGTLDGWRVWPA